jgi:hypothetical protein
MVSVQIINRPKKQSDVLKWLKAEEFSFQQETALANSGAGLASPGQFDYGLVVGKQTSASLAVAAAVAALSNTGNGTVTLGSPAYAAGALIGTYEAVAISAFEWQIFDPYGRMVGIAKDATAFLNQISLTITHGSTAFVAGDSFSFAVTLSGPASGKVVPLNPAATDGSQNAIGVIVDRQTVPASSDVKVVVAEREAILLSDGVIWPAGITSDQQAAAIAQLAAVNILVRNSY